MCFILRIIFFHFLGKKKVWIKFFTFFEKKFGLYIFHFLEKKVRIIYYSLFWKKDGEENEIFERYA